jgi:hypothetical protein
MLRKILGLRYQPEIRLHEKKALEEMSDPEVKLIESCSSNRKSCIPPLLVNSYLELKTAQEWGGGGINPNLLSPPSGL